MNFARFVFSQSCSVFFWVVSLRLRIISLMLSLSAATSPRASTVMDRVRSPLVTAVATSAMARRTWVVRLAASWLTFSVSIFQVLAAPGTLAWPPSLPFDPHLAGDGGLPARPNVANVSVISCWIVSARAAISPLASTISLRFRSPLAHGVVTTLAMPSHTVRGKIAGHAVDRVGQVFPHARHAPDLCAWPPSCPSEPTSRATRVTSLAKLLS